MDIKRERSFLAATFILISGGIKTIESSLTIAGAISDQVAWYAGSIIGAFLAFRAVRFSPKRKKLPFLFAGVLVTIGGIIAAASKEQEAVTASYWLDGIGFGAAVLVFIIASGENSTKFKRGELVSIESLAVSTGYLIFCIIYLIYAVSDGSESFTMIQTSGVLSIVLGLAACAASFLFIETPVSHLWKGDENEALQAVAALHNESSPSPNAIVDYEELKEYVQYDESKPLLGHEKDGAIPLIKIIVIRAFMTLAFVYPMTLFYNVMSSIGYDMSYAIIWFGLSRWIGAFFGRLAVIDKFGRVKSLAICAFISGVLYIVTGVLADRGVSYYVTAASLVLIANLCLGMSQNVSSVYLSETFSTSAKDGMIFLAILFENIAVIIVIASMQKPTSLAVIYYVYGAFQILIAIMAVTVLPETRYLSLKSAMKSLHGSLHIGF